MRLGAYPLGVALALLFAGCGDEAPAPDCASRAACQRDGLCAVGPGGTCIAAVDADCRDRSEACASFGRCTAQNGVCVATRDAECQKSSLCQIYGGCHAQGGRCLALSDADCLASSGCKTYGWCKASTTGECVKIGS